jgi:protoheme ferro-lyase
MTEQHQASPSEYDAVLVVSFGGPEGPDDVLPFLENVTRGRGVPRERLERVAAQYDRFGGVSPINAQNRALIAALEEELVAHGSRLPVYFGNRNWHPLLEDTVARMMRDGVRAALAFVTSAYSSYSGCRQYREDIAKARADVGASAPLIEKLRPYWNHPGFIEPMAANLRDARASLPPTERAGARVVFTAHSLPQSMAATCDYDAQLEDAARLIAERAGVSSWDRVYQSRSGDRKDNQPASPTRTTEYGFYVNSRGRTPARTPQQCRAWPGRDVPDWWVAPSCSAPAPSYRSGLVPTATCMGWAMKNASPAARTASAHTSLSLASRPSRPERA